MTIYLRRIPNSSKIELYGANLVYQLLFYYYHHRQHIKKRRHCFADKGPSSQSSGFSSSHVWMWELNCKGSWALKNWCFWTVVLEKTLESPLDYKEIQPVHPKGNQSWIFIGRTDAEAETHNTLVTWCKELTHWKRHQCWERLKVGGEGDDSGWDGWMASPTQCTWVWASSGSWWWTDRAAWCAAAHGVAKSRTEWLNWTDTSYINRTKQCYQCLFKKLREEK